MYGFSWSESNFGRGDAAPERGLTGERIPGERIPGNPELAMLYEGDRVETETEMD